uniref:Uncharacterized protein n=1 Tax=Clytia hemisphaerica TaxID=252671 RepID=A0A7M5VFL8_9CNID
MIDFIDFLIMEKVDIHPKQTESHKFQTLTSAKLRMNLWRKKLTRLARLDKHKREHVDEEMIVHVSDEQVVKFEKTQHAERTRRLFDTLIHVKLTRTKFCRIRDYLYTRVHFSNSHRSGVTANMTMAEYEKAKQDETDGTWNIMVWDHKTNADYGPAHVELTADSYNFIKTYVEQIRPKMKRILSKNVFLSWEGKSVTSGDVSKRIHLLWVKAGIVNSDDLPKNITVNLIRKASSTAVLEKDPAAAKHVASLMAHSSKTQSIHYNVRNRRISAKKGSRFIRNHFYGDSPRKIGQPMKLTKSEV